MSADPLVLARGSPAGLLALIRDLDLRVPEPTVRSSIIPGARRTHVGRETVEEYYPRSYTPQGITGHLRFAMRYEPIDLGVLAAAFRKIEPAVLENWVRAEPTGIYARRAWYLYEQLTGRTLDVPDVAPTGYADLLDARLHITGPVRRISRQRINDNLLGDTAYCPLIRRTAELSQGISSGWTDEALALIESCDPSVLARAIEYLYTQETKSSFAIEAESPSPDRTRRFVSALTQAADFASAHPQAYIELQKIILDPRYAATNWRTTQNYVGKTMNDMRERVYFISPRPEDVTALMGDWMRLVERLLDSEVDPVCAAAAASFGFVFVHPFEDGNGRIHRFLIHHVLARMGFTPPGLLFPVSAVMLRDRRAYDQVLEGFSRRTIQFAEWSLDGVGALTVTSDTAPLYRYWDATPFAEYLYRCVRETIRRDLREEIGFLQVFDQAVRDTMEIVDMPDRRASLLVRLIIQNAGWLPQAKRPLFSELRDEEIAAIELAVQRGLESVHLTRFTVSPVPRPEGS